MHQDFEVPIGLPHSLLQDRSDSRSVYIFEVFGSCLKFNLDTGESIKIDHRTAKEMFNGHAIQTRAGDLLLCTQIDSKLTKAILTFREAESLKKVAEGPKECEQAHHLIHLPEAPIVVCGNATSADGKIGGGITFFNYQKGSVLSRVDFKFPVLHVLAISADEIIGVPFIEPSRSSATRQGLSYENGSLTNILLRDNASNPHPPGPLYYAKSDGTKKEFWDESKSELLSYGFGLAKLSGSGRFLSGHLGSNAVVLWEDFKAKHVFSVIAPTNIIVSADGSEFLVATQGNLRAFSLRSYNELPREKLGAGLLMLAGYQENHI